MCSHVISLFTVVWIPQHLNFHYFSLFMKIHTTVVYSWLGLNLVSMKENKTCKDQNFYQVIKMALSEMYIHTMYYYANL